MSMTVDKACSIANKVRGSNSCYTLPGDVTTGDCAQALYTLALSLKKYRQAFSEHVKVINAIERPNGAQPAQAPDLITMTNQELAT